VSTRRFLGVAVLLFTVLTAALTWPQIVRMRDGVHDPGDPLMVTWVLAWVAHQLPFAPGHLFDANIFYPERNTLAYSEAMVVPGAAAAPLRWVGVSPIVVYNLVFLSGFVLSGAGTALLVRRLTGSVGAALVAGIVFAFAPYRIDHYAHLQLQQTQFIPLSLWAFHRLLDMRRIRDGVVLGLSVAAQMLSCLYYGLFLVPYMAVVCGTILAARRALTRDRMIAVAAAAAVVIVATLPAVRAYLGARKVVGERGRQEVMDGSARPYNYLAPPEVNLVYGDLFDRFRDPERRLFPGFLAVVLAVVALWPRAPRESDARRRDIRERGVMWAYALGLLVAFDVSLGFNGILYTALYDYFLPFRALRIPARMGIMVSFSLAVLAGYGAARLGEAVRAAARRAAFVSIGVLLVVEYASKPLPLWSAPTAPPAVYADIIRDRGDSPTAVIFEFPTGHMEDPEYLYYSTFHWQYLVNGYSGFFPPSYLKVVRAVANFPDRSSFDAIKSHGARYVVVHGEWLYGARYQQLIAELDRRPDLKLISRHPWTREDHHSEISAYRISYP
jgi:hypothetical protein